MQREDLNFYLQYAALSDLQVLSAKLDSKIEVIQAPTAQTLLLPVKDPISQGEFYGGEVLVTTTLVRLERGGKHSDGFAMVLDDNEEYSYHIALLDAYVGFGEQDALSQAIFALTQKAKEAKQKAQEEQNQKIDSTRVQFEIM